MNSTCQEAKWSCTEALCPGRCKVEGSSITTFDGEKYNHPGNCHFLAIYVCTSLEHSRKLMQALSYFLANLKHNRHLQLLFRNKNQTALQFLTIYSRMCRLSPIGIDNQYYLCPLGIPTLHKKPLSSLIVF